MAKSMSNLILVLLFYNSMLLCQLTTDYSNVSWEIYHRLDFNQYVDATTDEWKKMAPTKKIALLQIPTNELKNMSTKELLEAHTNSFFVRTFFLHSKIDDYYRQLFTLFNLTNELIEREDIVSEIIQYYSKMNPLEDKYNRSGIQMCYQVQFVEYLIGNPSLVEKYSMEDLTVLINELVQRYNLKSFANPDKWKIFESNIYAISILLYRNDTGMKNDLMQIENIDELHKTGRIHNPSTEEQIILLANNFIDK